jgi:threonine/homoserine/homoserine lactone efflux protein
MRAMPDATTYALFCLAAITLIVIPGPAVLYIVSQSIDRGRTAGLASAVGVAVGGTVHVAAAALGLSSLLVSSAIAFSAVKYLGAAYLVYLGIRTLLAGREPIERERTDGRPLRHVFARGIVVNVLNPKTALFFFAFLPQFADTEHGRVSLQIALLGTTFVVLALLSDSVWAVVAGAAAERLRGGAFIRARRWVSGTVLIGLGVVAAVGGSRKA